MDQGIAALLGALIGGLLTAGASWWIEYRRDIKHSRNLAFAVAGEVAAVAELVRRRLWLRELFECCLAAKRGVVIGFETHLPPEILVVSRSAMQHAGNLPGQLPALVPRVVMMGDGIISDLRRLAAFDIDEPHSILQSSHPASAEQFYTELLGIMLNALRLCDEIVLEVNRLYPDCSIRKSDVTKEEAGYRQEFNS